MYNTFENGVIIVPLKYKIDVIFALKERGYTTYKLRQEKLLSEGALQSIRTKAPI